MQQQDPTVLKLRPTCKGFSRMHNANRGRLTSEEIDRRIQEARVLLYYSTKLVEYRHKRGRKFAFEHPSGADTWREPIVLRVSSLPGVMAFHLDQCRLGLSDPVDDSYFRKAHTS